MSLRGECRRVVRIACLSLLATGLFRNAEAQTRPPLPPASDLQAVQLHSDFTLIYKGVTTRNSSPEALKGILDANSGGVDYAVQQGQMTKEQGEERKKWLANVLATHKIGQELSKLVVSYHQRTLLLQKSYGTKEDIALYDGKNTYSFDSKNNTMYVEPGLLYGMFQGMPYPGVGLPYIPLIKLAAPGANDRQVRGDVFTDHSGPGGMPLYAPGEITLRQLPGKPDRVDSIEWKMSGLVNGKYEFSGEAMVGDVPVARKIRRIQFDPYLSHPSAKPVISFTTEFTLESSSTASLPTTQFDPTTYLKASPHDHPERIGSHVKMGDEAHSVYFEYQQGKTLEQQREEQAKHLAEADEYAKTHLSKRNGAAGPVLLAALVICGIVWLLRRKNALNAQT